LGSAAVGDTAERDFAAASREGKTAKRERLRARIDHGQSSFNGTK
jgi:hypothetical protein